MCPQDVTKGYQVIEPKQYTQNFIDGILLLKGVHMERGSETLAKMCVLTLWMVFYICCLVAD